jgi:LysR family glycine cleavage system transcriptional activator
LSFTKAADELCVTQSAVSHQIKMLENELGTKLLVRGKTQIELTEAGLRLLRAAQDAFNSLAQTTNEIRRDSHHVKHRVSLWATPQVAQFWLAPRLTKFVEEFPDTELCIRHSARREVQSEDDELITIEPSPLRKCEDNEDLLFRSDLVPLCSPALERGAGKTKRTPEPNKVVLLCETAHDWWSDWNRSHRSDHAFGTSRIYFEDSALAVHVAAAGQGWLLGSHVVLGSLIKDERLRAPMGYADGVVRATYVRCGANSKKNSAVGKFRTWLMDESASSRQASH